MKKRLLTALLGSALLLSTLAGCGGQNAAGAAASDAGAAASSTSSEARDELISVNYRDIRDLNPHLSAGEMYAQSILYDTLVSNTEEGYVGCLAEDWTISEDGRIELFHHVNAIGGLPQGLLLVFHDEPPKWSGTQSARSSVAAPLRLERRRRVVQLMC